MENKYKFVLISLKRKLALTVLIVMFAQILSFGFGCSRSIEGDGKVVSKSYVFADQPFDSIECSGSGDIQVRIDDKLKSADATIVVDSNLLPYTEIYVKNRVLHIKDREGIKVSSWKKKEITINTFTLKSFVTNGASDSSIETVKSDDFDMELNGSSSIDLNLINSF